MELWKLGRGNRESIETGCGRRLRVESLEDRRMLAAPQVTNVFAEPGPVAIGQNDWYTEVDPPTAVVVSFDEELSTIGGDSGAASVINPANWLLTRDEVDVSSEIAGIAQSFNAVESRWEATLSLTIPLADGAYVLTLNDDVTDLDGEMLDGDGDNAAGGDFVRNFVVAVGPVKLGDEVPVNTFTTDHQQDASIAMDADGNYVIVWASFNQDGGGNGVYGQRYNAAGDPQGDEFLVNTTTDGNQQLPVVAMDDDGDFVVIFDMSSVGGGNDGLYMQRYNAAGEPQDGQTRITEPGHSGQGQHDIAMDGAGNFIVTWFDDGTGETAGIFAQRFNSLGESQGGIFQVNTFTSGTQWEPVVAMDDSGNFTIVWQSFNQDGNNYGIFGQRYNAAGMTQGSEFPVNTFTTGAQNQQDIAMDADGNFVVVWHTDNGPSGDGVYGQRYAAGGMTQGGEFLVAATNAGNDTLPAVAMDEDGDFVVTYGRNLGGADDLDIFGRRFSAAGEPRGEEFEVNTYKTDDQEDSALAIHPEGDFVVAWESEDQDGNDRGVYSQRFTVTMPAATGFPGDYNGDGFVNAADFVLWRDTLGSTTNLAANGDDSNNVIDEADYDVWVNNFGAVLGAGSAAQGTSHVGEFLRNSQPSAPPSTNIFSFDSPQSRLEGSALRDAGSEFRRNSPTWGEARMLALLDLLDSVSLGESDEDFSDWSFDSRARDETERESAFAAIGSEDAKVGAWLDGA